MSRRGLGRWALAAGALLSISAAPVRVTGAPVAPMRAPHADEAPRGMVAFVDGATCPTGWTPAELAAGRVLVGTATADVIGRVVGEPLAAEEDRAHAHALTTATLALPYKSIAAADGGNQNGAAAGAQPLTGEIAAAPSGLPFIQLTACVAP